jgi:hypothetical protein
MRKWLVGVLLAVVLLPGSIYFFIPPVLNLSVSGVIACSLNGVTRNLLDENKWTAWWPRDSTVVGKEPDSNSSVLTYNGFTYDVSKLLFNGLELAISQDSLKLHSTINLLHLSNDSVGLVWKAVINSGSNPIKRIQRYRQANNIKNNMLVILNQLKLYLEKGSNIYGVDIREVISKDSTLIATKITTTGYPSTTEIYRLVKNLQDYAATQGARENNYPMLSVRKQPDEKFETMVAIPINKRLKGNGVFFSKRFVPWKTLMAEVKGGPSLISKAYDEMKTYTNDYQRASMSIPFESLVTDRSIERDTLKWITVICQPVS